MKLENKNTNISPEKNGEIELDPKVITQLNDSKENLLELIAFQHIREELEKFNDGNHLFIVHQTIEQNANLILGSPYFGHVGLVGTALIANLDTIIKASYFLEKGTSGPGFQLHKSSDSLVIMIIDKRDFKNHNGILPRNLNDIDDKISDFIVSGEINQYGLPNECVWGYINGVSYHKNRHFSGKIGHYK